MIELKYKVGEKFKGRIKPLIHIKSIEQGLCPYRGVDGGLYSDSYLDSLEKVTTEDSRLRPTQWTLKMGDYEEQHYTLSIEDEGGEEFIVLKQTYLGQEIKMAKEEVDAICEALQVLKRNIEEGVE